MRGDRAIRSVCTWALASVLASVALLGVAADVHAESIESVTNPRESYGGWVSDMAGVFTPGERDSLDAIIDRLERDNGAEIAVVTVRSTEERTPREYATALFNRWGIGKRDPDNGVLVLIVTGARRIEVETGYGAEAVLPDGRIGRILDSDVIPRFRDGDWGGGAIAGVESMAAALREEPAPALPLTSAPERRPFPIVLLLALSGLLAAGGAWFQHARITRHCSTCGRRMRLLSEQEDDAYLDAMEQFEERLQSVNHVAWRCDACQTLHLEHHPAWFSGYRKCPRCSRRTLARSSITLRQPTYTSEGQREITEECKLPRCGYVRKTKQAIARLEESSSSSSSGGFGGGRSSGGGGGGGSFGGGSSGGGGAGRSW